MSIVRQSHTTAQNLSSENTEIAGLVYAEQPELASADVNAIGVA
jgi:hypothetical protein